MKIAIFPDTCAQAGKPVMKAFVKSLHGEDVIICSNKDRPDADVVVMWSVLLNIYGREPIYNHYKNKPNTKLLILEVGGLMRNHSWRVGINGINAEADFANQNVDDKRLQKLGLGLKPWTKGEHIIVTTQNSNSAAWPNIKPEDWCRKILQWLRQHTDRKIYLRPHPRHMVNLNRMTKEFVNVEVSNPKSTGNKDEVDFKALLQNAHAVVNYNSNPAIESVMAGVPVFVDKTSLCYEVGNKIYAKNVENPDTPDRQHWLQKISYCEWFVDEIEQGMPWKRLKENL